ncbi:Protein kinase [Sorangium cellulosum So ce56]|uniref:Protein kinase n=1 Tax=Sorangium cellulosum (strain So ce56) TaxID=448385 RepID=A9GCM8_SORC5|nr:serine/threonine-protein kinase [Sorangium cellulosum]CAN96211.1 Protein kinase [Sorangium cellulosum So ce56]
MQLTLNAGDVLAGKYRVERVLGQGGMGLVVAARHAHLRQLVAIKVLLSSATPEVVERFLREGRASVRMKSEHAARIHDVDTLPSGAPYMVMEYLDGRDLSAVIEAEGPLPIERAVGYVLEACEAIAEAHAHGIVHRDIKPANLFLAKAADGSEIVKVLDFGISKAMTDEAGGPGLVLTKSTAVLGSPLYMSPEQMRASHRVDARSDIWSMGVVLYQLLTARIPFPADTFGELVLKVNTEPPDPITPTRTDLPRELEGAIHRCLEKDAARRFANMAELARAIAPFGPPLQAAISPQRIERVLGVQATPPASAEGRSSQPYIEGRSSQPSQPPSSLQLSATEPAAGLAPTPVTHSSWATGATRVQGTPRAAWLGAGVALALVVGGILYYARFVATEPQALDRAGQDAAARGGVADAAHSANAAVPADSVPLYEVTAPAPAAPTPEAPTPAALTPAAPKPAAPPEAAPVRAKEPRKPAVLGTPRPPAPARPPLPAPARSVHQAPTAEPAKSVLDMPLQ